MGFKSEIKYDVSPETNSPAGEEAGESLASMRGGTLQDKRDMYRVGNNQELNRNFRFVSVLGFAAVLMCTWEVVMIASATGLLNGGLSGMIYTYIGGLFGFSFVILSMAEMASMAPTSGGQYHWVSEFAPASSQKFLSYVTGWVCVLGWHTGIAGCSYTVANMIVGLIAINNPDHYHPKPWHGTLLIIAIAFMAIIFNTFFAQKLPFIEGVILLVHVFGFFAVLIPLWVLAPLNSAEDVFLNVVDRGGWGNNGLACLVGLGAPIYALIAEEIRDASRVLPLSMLWTLVLNGSTGLIMLITYAFCVYDVDKVLKDETGFPFISVFLHATRSVRATTAMTSLMLVLQACSAISNVATTSRQLYAFARDGGIPFPSFFAKIDKRFVVPLNSLCVSFFIVCLLSLINIGSSVAFQAIISLGTASLLSSYIISISCVRLRRWRGEPLPPARWSMGAWSSTVETMAILFLLITFGFSFFPLTREVTTMNMNWSCAIFGGVIIFALIYYFAHARNVYQGPVTRIRPWAEAARID
ncbi:conserved hypothetical protein [Microsporum canis CBS 113480]|uniref:Amino acid permease n=1 Tax=Arthroderma otae (strain ATCC MYA-4605 / CBS 113480) TaxID=554155 RepID=C5FCJ8_ARTOC|nr:conserved hypothetical protein [Microsporum canis CBS 113480]EEQ27532.1 conserved hypothetical protein [Microsporum canis CBS 113480]